MNVPVAGRFVRIVPDLVVEILSPATSRRDQTAKKPVYEPNGVEEYWLVDPAKKTVTLYSLENGRYGAARLVTRGRIHSRVLPALRVTVGRIFDLGVT